MYALNVCFFLQEMPRPPNRVITRERVAALREAMRTAEGGLDAYIVLISDDHGVITRLYNNQAFFVF